MTSKLWTTFVRIASKSRILELSKHIEKGMPQGSNLSWTPIMKYGKAPTRKKMFIIGRTKKFSILRRFSSLSLKRHLKKRMNK